ncbi:beta-1,3-galactosyltransferase 5 [Manduca sexta]|uniref:beta-1,3-galactosyltransferase 5 n=1 Tax=Manduca sexta TaxID=7130 RepID=UPI001181FB2B|nr:beta-1,3-galactosyltransferase 5 [Manduca sexta]
MYHFGHKSRRKKLVALLLVLCCVAMLVTVWLLDQVCAALALPPPPVKDLSHFRRDRSLAHYLDNVQLLIEPLSTHCSGVEEIPLLALVATSPSRYDHRAVVRETWGKYQPTYFLLGLDGDHVDEDLVSTYLEAKLYRDMIVYDFRDHYQNLTLKTALMLQWTLERCPQAKLLYKIDDDVFLNPWRLKDVLKDHEDAKLLGYKISNNWLHRDEYNKWYIPRWLFPRDVVPEYLSGPGYIFNTKYINEILKTARKIPMINLEDIYFTFLVSKEALGLELSDDKRMNVFKPLLPFICNYWSLASAHSLTPQELETLWKRIENLPTKSNPCSFYNYFEFF